MAGDTFVEKITVIDEWQQSDKTKTRLINKGAGPDVVQEFHNGEWVDAGSSYEWGILTSRIKQLVNG